MWSGKLITFILNGTQREDEDLAKSNNNNMRLGGNYIIFRVGGAGINLLTFKEKEALRCRI